MIVWGVTNLFGAGLPWPRTTAGVVVDGPPKVDAQRILLVGELFGKIPRITPKGKVRPCGVRGAPRSLALLVQQGRRVFV